MNDIFLSYDGRDLERVEVLAAALESKGWTVFFDRTIPPGKTWRQFIGKEIDECLCMVVAWSTHSVNSHWVCEEADDGLKRKVLVPILLDQIIPPWGFRSIQAASFVGWEGDTNSSSYLALCNAVTDLIGQPGAVQTKSSRLATPSKPSATLSKASIESKPAFIEPEMVVIPAGSFLMGGNVSDDEEPVHTVTFAKPFWIAKNLVTFDQYDLFARANKRQLPDDRNWGRGQRPVINVSWEDATEYAS